MPVDSKYLREHYASLSDEALMAIDRAELVEAAQKCYDDEVSRRRQALRSIPEAPDPTDEPVEVEPGWLPEAAEVYSRYDQPGAVPAEDVASARDALEAAGIPCHLDLYEEEKSDAAPPTHRWRVLVPGNLNVRATSVLERDIFNQDFEAGWKTYLETLSDEELDGMKPEVAFCGLFDKVERVRRAYDEEIGRRVRG
jgi:hypothetical protein